MSQYKSPFPISFLLVALSSIADYLYHLKYVHRKVQVSMRLAVFVIQSRSGSPLRENTRGAEDYQRPQDLIELGYEIGFEDFIVGLLRQHGSIPLRSVSVLIVDSGFYRKEHLA